MMNILVTGSKGQLGTEIKNISKDYPDYRFTFVDIEELDLVQQADVQNFFSHNSFDYCINCAAYTAVDKAEKEVSQAMEINASAAARLARICSDQNTFLIHISTDYVFNGRNHKPYLETDPPSPNSVYGNSKLKGEEAVMQQANRWFIIRTSWLYSSHGHNFVKTIKRLASGKEVISVVGDQVGTPTFAGDLAVAIMEMIGKPGDIGCCEIYHFSNEGVASWYDFALAIIEDSNLDCSVLPIETKDFPTPASRPNYSVLSKKKIKNDFGIEIPYWRDSLRVVLKQLSGN